MDPPEHAQYRNLFSRRLTPKAAAIMRPRLEEMSEEIIESVVERLIDRVSGEGVCDFVFDLSMRLPVYTICELMGVPREDAETMFHWTNESLTSFDPEIQNGRTQEETQRHGTTSISNYFAELAERRRADPKEDVITSLANARINGEPIPARDFLDNAWLLLVGGNETTRNVMTGAMLALIENPDQMARLRSADQSGVRAAVEEFLRWVSPVTGTGRMATRDVEFGGQPIKEGDFLHLVLPSGNRDDAVFEDPYRFDITRDPNPHVTFSGYGEHFCVGANLARQEMYTAFPMFLERFEAIDLAGAPQRTKSAGVTGYRHMPVKLKTRRVFAGAR
jgi:cholest-4-en-3-one 26-monooxygenase